MQEWTGVAGKRVVITGATGGIGLAAAKALAARGAQLTIVARSQSRAEAAARAIEAAADAGATVETAIAELSSQSSVRALAAQLLERHARIEVLINNAGAIYAHRQRSEDGLELTWAVNHLAPFLLTNLLLARLRQSAPARVITTTSDAHKGARIPFDDLSAERSYSQRGFTRYGQTKLANILFTLELDRRLEGSGVTAYCFHPGLVASGFNRNNGPLMSAAMAIVKPFSRSPARGAQTLVWLADSPAVSDESGGYFVDERRVAPSEAAQDLESALRLWELSETQVGAGASEAS